MNGPCGVFLKAGRLEKGSLDAQYWFALYNWRQTLQTKRATVFLHSTVYTISMKTHITISQAYKHVQLSHIGWVIYTEATHEKKVQEHLAVHVHMFLSMHTHIHVWVGLKVHWSALVCLDRPVGSQMINGIMDSQAAGQSFNHQH